MLTVHQLEKSFNLQKLFQHVTFSLNAGDRVGLIGFNGSGKSTLLKILVGEAAASGGAVTRPPGQRIGYLPQGADFPADQTVGDAIRSAVGDPEYLEAELGRTAVQMSQMPDDAEVHERYDRLLRQLSRYDVGRIDRTLRELGVADFPAELPVQRLSGGQKTRLMLAFLLLDQPDLLLLDEPTNHLDIGMLEWLEDWLNDFPGGVLTVSHDRVFLDRIVNRILDFDPHQKTLVEYPGSYTDYLEQYQAAHKRQWDAWKEQQAEIRRIRHDIIRTREQSNAVHRKTTPRNPGARKVAKKVMKKAQSREKKLARYLESDERVEKPQRSWQLKVDFSGSDHLGRAVLDLENLTVGYSAEAPLFNSGEQQVQGGQRIVITGENGIGKTTLLRTLAGHIPPLSGRFSLGSTVQIGFMTQEQELLDPDLSPFETLDRLGFGDETEIRSYLHYYLFKDDEPLKPNRLLSYGQRARLALAVLIAQGCNLLLLDEPINHLDIPSRTQFEQALLQFPGTILAVVHDRYFINRVATEVWWVEGDGIRVDY